MEENLKKYIRRSFDLARLGAGAVSPNPMVGALLVYQDQIIIGEGYHQRYGEAHAEVNAIASVLPANRHLISKSTLYVSLEPCCIFGKTPPCTELIIREKIPRVVISCLDLTPEVSGKGVEKLRAQGIDVITGVLEKEGRELAAPRNVSVSQQRPFIILKMAQTPNGYFCPADRSRFWITQPLMKRLVHRWRMEADAILIGTNTALVDDPQLDNRYYFGKSPLRIILDRQLKLPRHLKIFNDGHPTLVVTAVEKSRLNSSNLVQYISIDFDHNFWPSLFKILWQDFKLGVVLVEGGEKTFISLLATGIWDEARLLIGQKAIQEGVLAPTLPGFPDQHLSFGLDELKTYLNPARS